MHSPASSPSVSSPLLGIYLRQVLTACLWGGTWIAGRVAVQELAPLTVGAWRYLLATLCLGGLVWWREGRLPWLQPREWLTLALAGSIGIALYNLCFLYGLQRIEAGRGALVVALNPVLVAVIAWLFGGEGMSGRKALGIVTALAGCLLVIGKGEPQALLRGEVGVGELLIVGCVLCWTVYTFVGRRATTTRSPLVATFYASLIGGALLWLAAIPQPETLWPGTAWRGWAAIVFLGLFGTALAFTWYAEGVQRLGAGRAAAFINLVPVAAVLLAAWLLDERLILAELAGGALVLAGVALTNAAPRGKG